MFDSVLKLINFVKTDILPNVPIVLDQVQTVLNYLKTWVVTPPSPQPTQASFGVGATEPSIDDLECFCKDQLAVHGHPKTQGFPLLFIPLLIDLISQSVAKINQTHKDVPVTPPATH